MDFLEMCIFFSAKWTIVTNRKKKLPIYRFAEWIGYAHLLPLHNERSPMPVGLKTVGGVGFEVTGNITFQERGFYNMY